MECGLTASGQHSKALFTKWDGVSDLKESHKCMACISLASVGWCYKSTMYKDVGWCYKSTMYKDVGWCYKSTMYKDVGWCYKSTMYKDVGWCYK